jgi:hypothetical protein
MKPDSIPSEIIRSTIERLEARHGADPAGRIRRGVEQVAQRWWPEDGGPEDFATFCEAHFLADPEALAATFRRLETILEQIDGHIHEVRRELTWPLDVDTGDLSVLDRLLAELDLGAHVNEDLFRTRTAFLALLNFPVHTLEERLKEGPGWDRETWSRSRLMDRFALRVPAAIKQEMTREMTAAEEYIGSYNLRMDRIVTSSGERPFREGLRRISHWGLRDELASYYADPTPAGLARQRLIQKVMERIVRSEIPAAVIDNPALLWDPETNVVQPAEGSPDGDLSAREPDTRYATLLRIFHAVRKVDPYSPTAPTFLARRFDWERQMPEREVEELLVSVLSAPEVGELARLIESRLGRPLEPFDIWYPGFKSRGDHPEDELDRVARERYPDLPDFAARLPDLLERLGFEPEKARWLASHMEVDPARGAGHAVPAVRRQDKARLRTRVPRGGMDYKGFNVAMHELGHNVEQVFSLHGIDLWPLAGVPNTACTEAFAFVFQHRDLEMLGMGRNGDAAGSEALAILWNTYEIAGVSLVDMGVWNWLYAHPEATPAELREATLAIARDVWNRYFAPVFGVRDSDILAIYSHMIAYALYLPDYAIGHIIAFQIAQRLREGDFGREVERITRQGYLTPDAWIRGAVGEPISARALLAEARGSVAAQR